MKEKFLILTLNPGSTSTKMALYENETMLSELTVRHTPEEFQHCPDVLSQKAVRLQHLTAFVQSCKVPMESLSAIVGRGGLIKPIESGTYEINERMLHDLSTGQAATHASALGGIIANELGKQYCIPAYIVDPVVVDEMEPVAKLSGVPGVDRKSVFHALNTKAVTRTLADRLGIQYRDGRFVVAHMGGGISVGAHRYGRVVDVSDAFNGEGPFSPERSGAVPLKPMIEMCYSGNYSKDQMISLVSGEGGLQAYLGTKDSIRVEQMVRNGDEFATLVYDAMAYQVAKEIGAMVAALEGRVNAIILTGGLAYSDRFTGAVKQRVDQIAPVITYPGEDELLALASGAYRVLTGKEKASTYQ